MPHKHAEIRPANELVMHCSGCNLVLAGWSAGLAIIRRDRTEIVAERIHSIRCHRCGQNNSINPTNPVEAVSSSASH